MKKAFIVESIREQHKEVKEKTRQMQDVLFVLNRENVWDRLNYIVGYFNINLLEHFKDEETVINVWQKCHNPEPDESMAEIRNHVL